MLIKIVQHVKMVIILKMMNLQFLIAMKIHLQVLFKRYRDGQQVWSKCNESCNYCYGPSNETTTNCKIEECSTTPTINPYYPYEADQTNCTQNPEDYFKNENGRWEPCYKTCASFELRNTDHDNQCKECKLKFI